MNLADARWRGGRRLLGVSVGAAVLGLGLCVIGFVVTPREALFAWLFAFVFWLGVALGALLWLGTFQASHARWPVLFRRALETLASAVVLFPALFLPIALGMRVLYPWVEPAEPAFTAQELARLAQKAPWLNVPFFLVRAALYFVVWCAAAWLLQRWSRQQDETGAPQLTLWQWRLGTGSLPFVGLALSFASLDWLMSLEPLFVSTIYALYFYAGSSLAALALLTFIAGWGQLRGPFVGRVRTAHLHSLGKLLLAFTVFWAYIAFDQLLLVWIANVPEEVRWYVHRSSGGWVWLAVFLGVGRFALPFLVLLSREVKERPKTLMIVSAWTFAAHVVDVYWLVFPAFHPDGPAPHWTEATAFLGIGGLCTAFVVWRLRTGYALPVRDPFLAHSLEYEPR